MNWLLGKQRIVFIFHHRQLEAQERLNQIHSLQLETIKMRDNIQHVVKACKHQQYIHDAAKKYQEVFNQIFAFVEKVAQVRFLSGNIIVFCRFVHNLYLVIYRIRRHIRFIQIY